VFAPFLHEKNPLSCGQNFTVAALSRCLQSVSRMFGPKKKKYVTRGHPRNRPSKYAPKRRRVRVETEAPMSPFRQKLENIASSVLRFFGGGR